MNVIMISKETPIGTMVRNERLGVGKTTYITGGNYFRVVFDNGTVASMHRKNLTQVE